MKANSSAKQGGFYSPEWRYTLICYQFSWCLIILLLCRLLRRLDYINRGFIIHGWLSRSPVKLCKIARSVGTSFLELQQVTCQVRKRMRDTQSLGFCPVRKCLNLLHFLESDILEPIHMNLHVSFPFAVWCSLQEIYLAWGVGISTMDVPVVSVNSRRILAHKCKASAFQRKKTKLDKSRMLIVEE